MAEMAQPVRNRASESGFTLVEVLVATALVAIVLAALATLTSQWLPNWNRGMDRLQTVERTALAIDRIAKDLAAAEFIYAKGEESLTAFEGTSGSVTLVRTAVGANAHPGLERVQIFASTNRVSGIVRSAAAFVPDVPAAFSLGQAHRDPDVLLPGPYALSFAYAGTDRVWRDSWRQQRTMPKLVQISISMRSQQRSVVNSTYVAIRADLPVECLQVKAPAECGSEKRSQDQDKVSQANRGVK
jgi:general secretion pathway protein J